MMEKNRSQLGQICERGFLQFVRFGIVGVFNTLISMGVYLLCFYGFRLHYQLSNLIAFVISVTNAYYWNNRFVFRNVTMRWEAHIKAYCKALFSYGLTYLLSTALLYLWIEKLGVNQGIAPAINLLITVPLNFMLNKFWAFRREENRE